MRAQKEWNIIVVRAFGWNWGCEVAGAERKEEQEGKLNRERKWTQARNEITVAHPLCCYPTFAVPTASVCRSLRRFLYVLIDSVVMTSLAAAFFVLDGAWLLSNRSHTCK